MGLIENFGRVASSYMEEKEQLQEVVWAWDQIKDSRNFK